MIIRIIHTRSPCSRPYRYQIQGSRGNVRVYCWQVIRLRRSILPVAADFIPAVRLRKISVRSRFRRCWKWRQVIAAPVILPNRIRFLRSNPLGYSENSAIISKPRRYEECGRGGTGRRTRFRSWRGDSWGFESLRPHHKLIMQRPRKGSLVYGEVAI